MNQAFTLKKLAFIWGIGGVILLLSFAFFRLTPFVLELTSVSLETSHWGALVIFILFMAYAEGYKGFFQQFSPRVVSRAVHLGRNPSLHQLLLAPLFCMGYFHATRRRKIVSFSLTTMIILLILAVRLLPQPWRGIIDAGVLVGLGIGILSIVYFVTVAVRDAAALNVSPELPPDSTLLNP